MKAILKSPRLTSNLKQQIITTTLLYDDYVDISGVPDNTIYLAVADLFNCKIAFAITTSGSAQYTVDWGDGIKQNYSSGAVAEHTYIKGTGKPSQMGFTTFKITITSTATILSFAVKNYSGQVAIEFYPILKANFGTSGLTSLANAFYFGITYKIYCVILEEVIFPSVLNSLTSLDYAFYYCYNIRNILYPNNLPALTSAAFAHYYNVNLNNLIFPNCPVCTTINNIFFSAKINKLTLGNLSAVTNMQSAFFYFICKDITGLENLGSSTSNVDASNAFISPYLLESIILNAKLSKIDIGKTQNYSSVNSIRLLNPNSPFNGTSPQLDISYNQLSASALNTLFGDLPIVYSGQTIKITGNPGAATCDTSIAINKGYTIIN